MTFSLYNIGKEEHVGSNAHKGSFMHFKKAIEVKRLIIIFAGRTYSKMRFPTFARLFSFGLLLSCFIFDLLSCLCYQGF